MSLLKQQLRRPRFVENSEKNDDQNKNIENVELKKPKKEDIRVKYEPGVILKVSFVNPVESDKIFKVVYLLLMQILSISNSYMSNIVTLLEMFID